MGKFKKHKIIIILLITSSFSFQLIGQSDSTLIRKKFYSIQQQSLSMLSGWSVLNIGISPILSGNFRNPDSREDHFHLGNFNWNLINLGISGFSHYSVYRKSQENWSISEMTEQKRKVEKAIVINLGLDLLYVIGGFALKYAANKNQNLDAAAYHGNGNSLILQGSYLLFYDAVFVMRLKKVKFKK